MEIKFKAWEKSLKEIIPVYDIDFANKIINTNSAWRTFDEVVLMQFTGLFDDNGEEIYDGYIVEIQDEFETKTSYVSSVIMTGEGSLVGSHPAHKSIFTALGESELRHLSHFCGYGHGGKRGVSCKIIGNIYENPELVK